MPSGVRVPRCRPDIYGAALRLRRLNTYDYHLHGRVKYCAFTIAGRVPIVAPRDGGFLVFSGYALIFPVLGSLFRAVRLRTA